MKFLSGSTCAHHTEVLLENDEYIVLKHNSHYEYIDRMTGSKTCTSFALLYKKSDCTDEDLRKGTNALCRWDKMIITKNKVKAYCKIVYNIHFKYDYQSPELFEEQFYSSLREAANALTTIDGIKI